MTNQHQASLLTQLRALIPAQACSGDALLVAEAQALHLRRYFGGGGGRFDTGVIASLPRIHVTHRELPISGVTYWDGQRWNIDLNRSEPRVRQRFTLLHEYKHVIDHGATATLYGGTVDEQRQRAEAAADYFAGCVLMPRTVLLDLWARGVRSAAALARRLDVSERAIEVRLGQLGLQRERCARPVRSLGTEQQFTIVKRKAAA